MQKKVLPTLFVILLFGLVFSSLYYSDSGITGHISAPFIEEPMDFYAIESQEMFIGLDDTSSIDLSSLRITGRVIGEGDVSIHIQDETNNKLLVFSNQEKKSLGIIPVTGFVVGSFCSQDTDCDQGEICDDGLCIVEVECYVDENCDQGEVCEEGLCTNINGCLSDLDCEGKEICSDNACLEVECLDNSDCANAICEENICVNVDCLEDSECDEDHYCFENNCMLEDIILELVQPINESEIEGSFFAIARYEINKGSNYKLKLFVDSIERNSYDIEKSLGIVDFVIDSNNLENGEHTLFFELGEVISKEVKFNVYNKVKEEVIEEEGLDSITGGNILEEQEVINETNKLIFVSAIEEKPTIKKSDIKGEKVYKFENECEDTCYITRRLTGNSYRLVIEVEKGTLLEIDKISYY